MSLIRSLLLCEFATDEMIEIYLTGFKVNHSVDGYLFKKPTSIVIAINNIVIIKC